MRAILGACAAMLADNGQIVVGVEDARTRDTRFFTPSAAHANLFVQLDAAALSAGQRAGRTRLRARRLFDASKTDS
jgi:hypothetical protein